MAPVPEKAIELCPVPRLDLVTTPDRTANILDDLLGNIL
jgi:hypothetical protein